MTLCKFLVQILYHKQNLHLQIHGGLRYLEHYDFGLVRKALREREVVLAMAPHIVWPLRFVLPHHPGLRPAWLLLLLPVALVVEGIRTSSSTDTAEMSIQPTSAP